MTDLAIDVHDLTKKFGKKLAVNHISLAVKKGSIFGFLGANGSGKTTTIRMICGLLTPTSGTGTCLGYDILTQHNEIKNSIGYMPQKFSFYKGLTVYENLRFAANIYQVSNPGVLIEEVIEKLGLNEYRNSPASSLSGGWQQRLALACCIVHKPQLLFLDEPTAGVDPKARKEFWDYLHNLATQEGTTVLITTHYMDEAEKCTDLAYINRGNLLYSGRTKDLIPKSQIKTYLFEGSVDEQNHLINQINHQFPQFLTSVISNDLRISSHDEEKLKEFLQAHSNLEFKPVSPSFEEIFIGLLND